MLLKLDISANARGPREIRRGTEHCLMLLSNSRGTISPRRGASCSRVDGTSRNHNLRTHLLALIKRLPDQPNGISSTALHCQTGRCIPGGRQHVVRAADKQAWGVQPPLRLQECCQLLQLWGHPADMTSGSEKIPLECRSAKDHNAAWSWEGGWEACCLAKLDLCSSTVTVLPDDNAKHPCQQIPRTTAHPAQAW